MGCCGHDFLSKEKIKEAVTRNTHELHCFKDLVKFRDRAFKDDLRFGVCRNLIEKNGKMFCPLHPALNKKDLREGHCSVDHLCKTAMEFEKWDEKKKEKFLDFIESKKLDNLDYSMMMDEGKLLKEFLDL